MLREAISYPRGWIPLARADIARQIASLGEGEPPAGHPMRMIGMREARSENSWMHNAPLLMHGDRGPRGLVNVDDAADLGIDDGTRSR